jgi:ubiquinone/menaquinone biosynthesis C-methylase UbiE
MSKFSDTEFLLHDQYKNTKNLEARSYLQNRFNVNKYSFNCWIFDHFPLTPKLKILELGCGMSLLWVKNINRIPLSWELTLTDISSAMINKTRKNLAKGKNKIVFKIVNAQKIPYKSGFFDIVIANHMLYHVPDRKKALSEIKRVLKPKGLFFASTTGRRHMKELKELLSEFDRKLMLWDKESKELFILENGAKELSEFFSKVDMEKFHDRLVVTEIKPLINYVLSTQAGKSLKGKRLNDFALFLRSKIKNGPIRITKDVGLFKATNS